MPSAAAENSAPVAIVGAGPVGLSLALGLARKNVRSVVLERNPGISERSKAPGVHVRTREVLRQWGVEERFLEEGTLKRELTLHPTALGRRPLATVDFSDLGVEADRPGLLVIEQGDTERLLLEAVREAGLCELRFGAEVIDLAPRNDGARLTFREDGEMRTLDAAFVVGCDGASSFVREALGLPFEGITYSVRPMLADVRIEDARDALPWPRTLNGRGGLTTAIRLGRGLWRLIRLERGEPEAGEEVSEEEVGHRVDEVLGEGPFEVVWASRFRIHRRAAPRMRVGRVLLAGDAAHVHSPVGGLGMNGGIQDAHNLAWKLTAALDGGDVDRLLDSYGVERRAVMVGSVSRYTDLITRTFLDAPAPMRGAAFAAFRLMLRSRRLRRRSLRRSAMLDFDYPASPILEKGARSAGVRLPDLRLRAPDGSEPRLQALLPYGSALLLLGEGGDVRADLPVDATIRIGPGGYRDPNGLLTKLLGGKDGWILVRPDGYVARTGTEPGEIGAAAAHALGEYIAHDA